MTTNYGPNPNDHPSSANRFFFAFSEDGSLSEIDNPQNRLPCTPVTSRIGTNSAETTLRSSGGDVETSKFGQVCYLDATRGGRPAGYSGEITVPNRPCDKVIFLICMQRWLKIKPFR